MVTGAEFTGVGFLIRPNKGLKRHKAQAQHKAEALAWVTLPAVVAGVGQVVEAGKETKCFAIAVFAFKINIGPAFNNFWL